MMRGIAILLVILVHTAQQIEGSMYFRNIAYYGQMGVQLFFVISAFTLCHTFELRKNENNKLLKFYIRRFFRIAPGYYFGILLYIILAYLLGESWRRSSDLLDILINILFLNGLVPSANNSVVPGGWSIGTEMIFYLLFPLIYISFVLIQKKISFFYIIFPFIFLLISLSIQMLFFHLTKNPQFFSNNGFIYFSILNQLPVFCTGISLYYYFNNIKSTNEINNAKYFAMFFILTIVSFYLMVNGNEITIFYSSIFPVTSALSFTFLFFIINQFKINDDNYVSKIGRVSFSSYLVHCSFTFYLVHPLSKIYFTDFIPDIQLILFFVIVSTATIFSANIVYKIIELNGLKISKKLISVIDKTRVKNQKIS